MIYINARFLTQRITGVQRYAIEICKLLPQRISEKKVIFLVPKETNIDQLPKTAEVITFGVFKGQLWEQFDLPIFLKNKGNPLLINFVGIGPIWYKNKVMMLYDLAFKHHPEWFSKYFAKAYNFGIPKSLKNSKRIITDSQYVKKDIEVSYKIQSYKIDVVYAAPSSLFFNMNLIKEKIILMVSSLDPRKNMNRAIVAFNSLDIPHKLIIVGAKGTAFSDLKISIPLKEDRIIFAGYLDDSDLVKLYNRAELFIYPSLFEGFGIPPLEAQKCGTACVVSKSTSLPEVYGNSVVYCDPYDIEDIKQKILKMISNKDERDDYVKRGYLNSEKYRWDKSTKQFISIIKKAI